MNKIGHKRDLIPEHRFGEYILGCPIEQFSSKVEKLADETDEFWKAYKEIGNDDIRIYTENENIVCVGAYEYCFYEGHNLIGKTINDVITILNTPFDRAETQEVIDEQQVVYRFDSLSLLVWAKNDRVVTVQCSEKVIDEDDRPLPS
jgi:hypothetical protein